MSARLLVLKTITTIRPFFFEDTGSAVYTYFDSDWRQPVTSVDLGRLHWNRQLDEAHLESLLASQAVPEGADFVSHNLDIDAVRALAAAKSLLAAFSERMLSAAEIIFCFRVLSRWVALVSRHEPAFDLHLARGLFAKEYNQYRLNEVLEAAQKPRQASRACISVACRRRCGWQLGWIVPEDRVHRLHEHSCRARKHRSCPAIISSPQRASPWRYSLAGCCPREGG